MSEREWIEKTCETCVFQRDRRCRKMPVTHIDVSSLYAGFPSVYPRVEAGGEFQPACSMWESRYG